MPHPYEENYVVRHESRQFLNEDTLDAVRTYVTTCQYEPNDRNPDGQFFCSAGFQLSEEGVGHFCCTADVHEDPADLNKVAAAARIIIAGLTEMIAAIEVLQSEKAPSPAASDPRESFDVIQNPGVGS